MLTGRSRRTVVGHRQTTRPHQEHALIQPQLVQPHHVTIVEPEVPQTAAIEVSFARVQQPRQLLGVRRSADEERRTQIQRAVVVAPKTIVMPVAVHREADGSAGEFDDDVMRLAVVDSGCDEEPLGLAATVDQDVEVAVAQFHREEVRSVGAGSRHHHHAVALDRSEVELHPAAMTRRPAIQTEVRPARRERDRSDVRQVGSLGRPGDGRSRLCVTTTLDNHEDVGVSLSQVDQIQTGWQRAARHHCL